MSIRLMADVWEFGPGDATQTHVLVVLANSADDEGGNCYPGTALIAQRTRLSERTVVRAISALERDGWITILQRGQGRPKTKGKNRFEKLANLAAARSQYQIHVEKLKRCHSVTLSECNEKVTPGHEKVTLTPRKGDIDDNPPDPLYGRSVLDPSMNPTPPTPSQGEGGAAPNETEPSGLNPEQLEHVERLKQRGNAETVRTWESYYRRENLLASSERAEAERRACEEQKRIEELRRKMPDLKSARAWVMRECGFVASRRGRGMEPVIERVLESDRERGVPWWETGPKMAAAWNLQQRSAGELRVIYGPVKFFEQGHWRDSRGWPWDRSRSEAKVGS